MFAVMKKFEMSWESFPERYRVSLFFKTDFDSFDRDDDSKQDNNSTFFLFFFFYDNDIHKTLITE